MPRGTRRPPPSALRLITGPTPPRSAPRHTLPSVPRPAFYPPSAVSRGPSPRGRQSTTLPQPGLNAVDQSTLCILTSYDSMSSPYSSSTGTPTSSMPTPSSSNYSPRSLTSSPKVLRGPWDHSGSIIVPIDLENVLTPLKPAAVSPGGR